MAHRVLCLLALVAVGEANVLGDAFYSVTKAMGTVENAISPEAFIGFCNTNGYTVWKGPGPQPVDSGVAGKAWSAYGKLTGFAVGMWLPEAGMLGKCDAAGWAKPGAGQGNGQNVVTVMQPNYLQGQVGNQVIQYVTDTNGNTVDPRTGQIITTTTITRETKQPTITTSYQQPTITTSYHQQPTITTSNQQSTITTSYQVDQYGNRIQVGSRQPTFQIGGGNPSFQIGGQNPTIHYGIRPQPQQKVIMIQNRPQIPDNIQIIEDDDIPRHQDNIQIIEDDDEPELINVIEQRPVQVSPQPQTRITVTSINANGRTYLIDPQGKQYCPCQ